MRGAGRHEAQRLQCRMGRWPHGPGHNVFSYFVEPNGFVVEYTAEVEQVDEATYHGARCRLLARLPERPCRWGMATHPSNRIRAPGRSTSSVADQDAGKRCEEIMAQTLAG